MVPLWDPSFKVLLNVVRGWQASPSYKSMNGEAA